MLKRYLGASLLLLVVAVQTLATDCELRCSTAMIGHHGCGNPVQSETNSMHRVHCHGMSMESGEGNYRLSASDHCRDRICTFWTEAIANQAGNEFNLHASSVALPVPSIVDPAAHGLARSAMRRSHIRQETQAPLDLRPGSSLRI